MTVNAQTTTTVKASLIRTVPPVIQIVRLAFSIMLLGFPPVLLLIHAESLKGAPFIALSALYLVFICTVYGVTVLSMQAKKLRREFGNEAFSELFTKLKSFEERKYRVLALFGVQPEWDYAPKSTRKAFYVNTGCGIIKLRRIKVKKPVLLALGMALAIYLGGAIIPTLLNTHAETLKGWKYPVMWLGYITLLASIYIAVRLPETWRKQKDIIGEEDFYYFHPMLKRLKESKERRAERKRARSDRAERG